MPMKKSRGPVRETYRQPHHNHLYHRHRIESVNGNSPPFNSFTIRHSQSPINVFQWGPSLCDGLLDSYAFAATIQATPTKAIAVVKQTSNRVRLLEFDTALPLSFKTSSSPSWRDGKKIAPMPFNSIEVFAEAIWSASSTTVGGNGNGCRKGNRPKLWRQWCCFDGSRYDWFEIFSVYHRVANKIRRLCLLRWQQCCDSVCVAIELDSRQVLGCS